MASTQTRRKRKVGQFLARLRERAGRTTDEVGALLRRNGSQISKIENGYNLCAFAELTTLLATYGATLEEQAEAQSLWDDAKQDSTRIAHSSAVPPKFRAYLRTEADAISVRELQPCTVPGLLQTSAFAAAIEEASRRVADPAIDVNRIIAARLARQELLRGERPLRLHAIIDEAVINRVVGSPSTMIEQLDRLVAAGESENVVVQVIEFGVGAYGTMSGPLTIFGFDHPDPDSVYLEYPAGGEWVDDTADVEKFAAIFQDVSALALPPAESAALIRARINVVKGL
jgi:transcriptional regulator with XRE-family HTH domain